MGKKINRILARGLNKKGVDTPELGSELTLDKLEAMEKDMRKVFKEDIAFPLLKPSKKIQREYKQYQKYIDVCVGDLKKDEEYEAYWDGNNWILKDKVIWEGREWLRSINDPNHERRMVGVMCLVLAVLYAVAVYVLI